MSGTNHRPGCCVDFASAHGGTGHCEGGHADRCMRLPEGKTCGDCAHVRRCEAFGFTRNAQETVCSFHPRRFHLREARS